MSVEILDNAVVYRSESHVILRCTACKSAGRRDYGIIRTVRECRGRPATTVQAVIGERTVTLRGPRALDNALATQCPECGSGRVEVRHIKGTHSDKPCGPRCLNAVGPSCDCKCGGENHGTGHGNW